MIKKEKPYLVLEAIAWYILVVYFLYSLKNPVNIYLSAFNLVVLGYLAFWLCPLVRHSPAWRKVMK